MCGFCGFTTSLNNIDNITIKNMTKKIAHRGPDSTGYHESENLKIGFRRLSFLGIKDGDQPIYNEEENLGIVFNGEIYNHQKLREELIEKGHTFKTHADTEVILHAYEEYGTECVNKLRGMFAFVIFEEKSGKVFAARDFFGIKPFYYTIAENNLIFASEIKAILEHPSIKKEVNKEALAAYLSFQYSPLEETMFKNIYKLMPGHFLEFEGGNLNITKYFEVKFEPSKRENISEEINKVLLDSIEHHKESEVEIGTFLSSGVDSNYIASRFGGEKSFTVGFNLDGYEQFNEIGYARDLSAKKGLTNISKVITTEEYWESIGKIQYHMDEPLADPSAVALYFVSKLAKEHVKGVLSGEGADEFFGGYNIYKEPLSLAKFQKIPKPLRKSFAGVAKALPFKFKGKSFLIRASKNIEERFIGNANIFSEKEVANILKYKSNIKTRDITEKYYKNTKEYDDITKMQYLDIHMWLVGDILLKADKMSMAHSLEVRVPFVDKEVWNFAKTLETKERVTKITTKKAFRDAAQIHLPKENAEKKKLGFPVPIRHWLREDTYRKKIEEEFKSETAKAFFNVDEILKLVKRHQNKEDNSRKIWTIYTFLIWHKQFFE